MTTYFPTGDDPTTRVSFYAADGEVVVTPTQGYTPETGSCVSADDLVARGVLRIADSAKKKTTTAPAVTEA